MNFLFANFRNTKLVTPFTVKRDKNTLHYTYLDTIGRPVIVAHKTNLNPWYHSLREEVYKTSLFCTKSGNVFAFVSMILRSEFGTVLTFFM
jgi:hypothetical protein